ncbi:MAG: DUF2330 domain-containing protein [Labilithrix sp.]|nr:DUF2330 domain-containing protein [Labilithrix sp.]
MSARRVRIPAAFAAFVLVGLLSPAARAFGAFYVSGADAKLVADASQVVLMREGTRTVLSMQNDYQGPPESFAMVVPVPVVLQKENVKTLPREIFARVDTADAPRLVEYWEADPCAPRDPTTRERAGVGASPRPSPPSVAAPKDLGVTVEAQFTVGEYEIVILGAKDSSGLDAWLKREGYKIPEGSEPYLRPYVEKGTKFFVARVDVTKVKMNGGRATLSPLRFHYDAVELALPIRLGLVNSAGTQDLIVHVLGKGKRYEVANYPNVTIPTNLDVSESAKANFGSFYAALFDRTLAKHPKAVVTEYAWDAGTCDPCPQPPLTDGELLTLGADVLPSVSSETEMVDGDLLKALGADAGTRGPAAGSRAPGAPGRRRYYGVRTSFVLTRLHARYTRDALGDDLVLREAAPVAGGREVRVDGALDTGATSSGSNAFQGRYAVRHPWTGPIACAEPVRNVWGAPPGGLDNGPARAARDLAYAARGQNVHLASFLRTDIAKLDVKAAGAAPSGVGPVPSASAPAPAPLPEGGIDDMGVSHAPAARSSCLGCALAPSGSGATSLAASAGALAALAARLYGRRRSR